MNWHALSRIDLMCTIPLRGGWHYPHFVDENFEDQQVKWLSWPYIFSRWQIWDLRPGPLTPNFYFMTCQKKGNGYIQVWAILYEQMDEGRGAKSEDARGWKGWMFIVSPIQKPYWPQRIPFFSFLYSLHYPHKSSLFSGLDCKMCMLKKKSPVKSEHISEILGDLWAFMITLF